MRQKRSRTTGPSSTIQNEQTKIICLKNFNKGTPELLQEHILYRLYKCTETLTVLKM